MQTSLSSFCAPRLLGAARTARRALTTDTSPPHAYLRPILQDRRLAETLQLQGGGQGGEGLGQGGPANPDLDQLDGVMALVLDRERTKNALSVRMVNEIREGIAKVSSSSSARVLLLLTPHPRTFCSGADLAERRTMSPSAVDAFLASLRGMISELEALHVPSIALIDGVALGGGAELAMGCDLRVGGPNAGIALPETKLGIIPGAGGTQRLTRLVGSATAKELIFTGRRIDGAEAERIGFLNQYVPAPSSPLTATLLLARQILTSAPLALTAAKRAIDAVHTRPGTLEDGLDLERALYEPLLSSEDRNEGLRAFAEKRRAVFTGR